MTRRVYSVFVEEFKLVHYRLNWLKETEATSKIPIMLLLRSTLNKRRDDKFDKQICYKFLNKTFSSVFTAADKELDKGVFTHSMSLCIHGMKFKVTIERGNQKTHEQIVGLTSFTLKKKEKLYFDFSF